ncbi:MAG TPA: AI-2E family transporter [Actinomycetota bacterium]|nr:AI-2E family transporter [Actinomycetota bacterium]
MSCEEALYLPVGALARCSAEEGGVRLPDGSSVTVPRPLATLAALAWRFLVVVAATGLVVLVLVKLRVVVLPVLVALLLSTLLVPPAAALRRRGWPPILAAWAVLLGSLLLLAGVIALLAPQVASELSDLGSALRQGTERVIAWLAEGPLELSRADINSYVDRAIQQVRENGSAITSGVLTGAVVVGEVVAGTILTVVLVFFFVKDGGRMTDWLTKYLSPEHHRHVSAMGERAWTAMSAYVRGTALIALVDAVLIGIALLLIGVPLVPALMVLTFFGAFFPLVGAVLAGLVAALVALVSGGPLDALLVLGAITVIQQVEGDVLQPVVIGRAVKLHPVVVLLSLTSGAVLAGIAGAFLAVPLTAVLTAIGSYLVAQRPEARVHHDAAEHPQSGAKDEERGP